MKIFKTQTYDRKTTHNTFTHYLQLISSMLKLITENQQNDLGRELRTKSLNSDLSYPSEIENIFTRERERDREREKREKRKKENERGVIIQSELLLMIIISLNVVFLPVIRRFNAAHVTNRDH